MKTYHGKATVRESLSISVELSDDFVMPDTYEKEIELGNKICANISGEYETDTQPGFWEEDGKKYVGFDIYTYAEVSVSGVSWEATYDEPGGSDEEVNYDDAEFITEKNFDKFKSDFESFFYQIPEFEGKIKDISLESWYYDDDYTNYVEHDDYPEPDYDDYY